MAKVEVTVLPWDQDRPATQETERPILFVESVRVDGVKFGERYEREGQLESDAVLTIRSGEFAVLEIWGTDAEALFAQLAEDEYLEGSNDQCVLLPVSSLRVLSAVTA